MTYRIEHDAKHCRFVVDLKPYEAFLFYARKGKDLDFYHIYVPDPYRNRGLAGRILIAAFDYAKKEGLKVIPSCPFIRDDFLPRFPQYQGLLARGKSSFPFLGKDEG
jgi:hypothetical protein